MKQSVVITATLPEEATRILSRRYEVISHPTEPARSEDELITLLAEADGAITLLTDPLTRRVLSSNPHLRVIGNYAVGVNNIDLEAAGELGIEITHTPGVLTEATADLTLALLLAINRRLIEGDRLVRNGAFRFWDPLLLLGASLQGKRLGIIGMGRIGSAVARRALAFGMEIVHHSRSPRDLDFPAEPLELEDLLRTSDFISIHTPLTPETHHLIDRRALELMKGDACIVNTSRGPVIDEKALVEALENRTIRGAALDVYEEEPEVEPRLLDLDNVVLLPHLGSATLEARTEMARTVAEDVTAVLEGGRPRFPVVSPHRSPAQGELEENQS
jgi:glyoxylate reductase